MMPLGFQERLFPILGELAEQFGTPFHIYDEAGIIETCQQMKQLLGTAWTKGYRNFFAVKALPNPAVMRVLCNQEFGFDCSSEPELHLALDTFARGEDIMFTSNNTAKREFIEARNLAMLHVPSCGEFIITIDDISFLEKLKKLPELVCFRYNPGATREGNAIIGNPVEAKYGVRDDQIVQAYAMAQERGAKRFGLHTMICSNQLEYTYVVETVKMILDVALRLNSDLGIKVEFVNIGGGIGIPYRPTDKAFDLEALAKALAKCYDEFYRANGWIPRLVSECGRYVTGPHGVLVSRVINRMEKYRQYVGLDACMSALMRPAIYGAYHEIYVPAAHGREMEVVDVVGSLCENNDKFAVQRELPKTEIGDLVVISNTGAHGLAMGFNYNGRLRPQELFLRKDGTVELIRRAETVADYFATLDFEPKSYQPKGA